MSKTTQIKFSFPFLSILCLIFITLKLTNVIAWSWWWVLAPIWIPSALGLFILFIIVVVILSRTGKKSKW